MFFTLGNFKNSWGWSLHISKSPSLKNTGIRVFCVCTHCPVTYFYQRSAVSPLLPTALKKSLLDSTAPVILFAKTLGSTHLSLGYKRKRGLERQFLGFCSAQTFEEEKQTAKEAVAFSCSSALTVLKEDVRSHPCSKWARTLPLQTHRGKRLKLSALSWDLLAAVPSTYLSQIWGWG